MNCTYPIYPSNTTYPSLTTNYIENNHKFWQNDNNFVLQQGQLLQNGPSTSTAAEQCLPLKLEPHDTQCKQAMQSQITLASFNPQNSVNPSEKVSSKTEIMTPTLENHHPKHSFSNFMVDNIPEISQDIKQIIPLFSRPKSLEKRRRRIRRQNGDTKFIKREFDFPWGNATLFDTVGFDFPFS